MKGPGLCSGVLAAGVGGGSLVDWEKPGGGRAGAGLVRFYKSQCKSRDKYYLLFEERHSRYLLYRGRGAVLSGTRTRTRSKGSSSEERRK